MSAGIKILSAAVVHYPAQHDVPRGGHVALCNTWLGFPAAITDWLNHDPALVTCELCIEKLARQVEAAVYKPVARHVVRARYVQPDGIGYLTDRGAVSHNIRHAARFFSQADAWTFLNASTLKGHDEQGDYLWVEELPE